MARKKALELAVIDYETDPFKYGRTPRPFVCGFYTKGRYVQFWGDDCVLQLVQFLDDEQTAYRIYAHNGGKFDFFLMLEHLENPIKVINGRIVKATLGKHELRDSYAIIPMPLSAYKKDEIDYGKFEREVREAHKAEICKYLEGDCRYLFELVEAFLARFGDKITIGATAITELKKFHPFQHQYESHDQTFRPFYFGGRVENFGQGILKGEWRVYDVNSMYPYVMAEYDHPTGAGYLRSSSAIMDKRGRMSGFGGAKMYFARIECEQQGAFPIRMPGQPLNFNVPSGEFFVTSHELKAAVKAGRVQRVKVLELFVPLETVRFKEFVEFFVADKIRAEENNDAVGRMFAKLILNSAYGKFGTNPDHYKDFYLQREGDEIPPEPYVLSSTHDMGVNLWEKPSVSKRFFDVATAASVTGAARSVLLEALTAARRPIYCDTDSIICEALSLDLDATRLGAWKLEARGETLALAGKKLYALKAGQLYPELPKQKPGYVKIASKGVRLTGPQIVELCGGKAQHWENPAPSFSLKKPVAFVRRKVALK